MKQSRTIFTPQFLSLFLLVSLQFFARNNMWKFLTKKHHGKPSVCLIKSINYDKILIQSVFLNAIIFVSSWLATISMFLRSKRSLKPPVFECNTESRQDKHQKCLSKILRADWVHFKSQRGNDRDKYAPIYLQWNLAANCS